MSLCVDYLIWLLGGPYGVRFRLKSLANPSYIEVVNEAHGVLIKFY